MAMRLKSSTSLAWHRESGRRNRAAAPDSRVLAFTGRKWEYATQLLGHLLGNDLYDSYLEGESAGSAAASYF